MVTAFFVILFSLTAVNANDFELVIKKVEQINEEEITIQYSVINRRNYNRNNVSLAFKILEEDIPVGCKEIKTTIPKGSDGSDIKETKIKISGKGKNLKINSTIFYITKRYRIDEWFSGCPNY